VGGKADMMGWKYIVELLWVVEKREMILAAQQTV